jgi:putative peptidoglycan lipid II flippase
MAETPLPPRPPSTLRSAGVISLFVGLSRLLGLVRELLLARFLGAGFYSDAYVTAYRIPNLLRDLFAEGALSSAFVPAYARARQEGGREAAHRLASRVLSILAVVLTLLILMGIAGAGPLVRQMAHGFEPDKAALTVLLTRIMMPFLALVSFAAVAMGMLNAEGEFGRPASAQSVFNIVAITGALLFWAMGLSPFQVAVGWSIATLVGGLAQLLIQLPPLYAQGWRFRFDWAPGDPEVRRLGAQMAPAVLGMAAVQINIFVSTWFLSEDDGAITWLQLAFRLLYLPIGLFGVALGTVATTSLARQAAGGDTAGLASTVQRALRNLAFLTVPSTVGLMLLAEPIVRLLFDHGRFAERPENAPNTAAALAVYSIGLAAYASIKILAPAFYALGQPRIPMFASACAVAANVVTVVVLHPTLGFRGIAAGLVVSTFVNVLVLGGALRLRVGSVLGPGFAAFAARTALAAALMGAAVHFGARHLAAAMGTEGTLAQAIVTLVPIGLGAGLYFATARLLQIPEAVTLFGVLRRRLQRS